MCQGCNFMHREDGTKVPAPENQCGPFFVFAAVGILILLGAMVMTWPKMWPWS